MSKNGTPTPVVDVIKPGALATIQDLGRHGAMSIGIPTSGAMDQRSHRLANRLVGNAETRSTIEATFGGLEIRFSTEVVVAVTGADVDVFVDGRQEAVDTLLLVPAGGTLRLGIPRSGLRSYVAVSGGFAAPDLYESQSTDLLSGLGPKPLEAGDQVPLGSPDPAERTGAVVALAPTAAPSNDVTCRVFPGPRRDWLVPEAWHTLLTATFHVGARSNRIGVRLEGPALERAKQEELRSEGLVTGAIQVPGDGQPVIFMHDHPTTGGYPVIGVVHPDDLPLLGQVAPGGTVHFRAA